MISLLQRRAGTVVSPLWSLRCCGLGVALAVSSVAQANNPPVSKSASSKPDAVVLTQDAQKRLMRNFGTGQSLDPVVMLQKGVSLMEANRTDEAVVALNKMASEYPQLPEPHNNLAVIYAARGQQDKARLALEAALRTHPAYAVAMENLTQVYARQAKEAYAKALPASGAGGKASSPAPTLTVMRHVVLPGLSVAPDLLAAVNSLTRPAAPSTSVPSPSVSVPAAPPTVSAIAKPAPSPVATAPVAAPPAKPTVVAAAPAPSAPPPAASKPAAVAMAAPSPTAVAALDRDAQQAVVMQVRQAVAGWARAWSRQDMDAYFAAYTPDYNGGKNRKAWMEDRRVRITGKKSIEVNVTGISVVMEGNAATAHFKQEYSAGDLQVTSGKRLRFVKVGDRWLIDKESVGS
jgi:ketosteroid isomerase-like protein